MSKPRRGTKVVAVTYAVYSHYASDTPPAKLRHGGKLPLAGKTLVTAFGASELAAAVDLFMARIETMRSKAADGYLVEVQLEAGAIYKEDIENDADLGAEEKRAILGGDDGKHR